jgi:hypothetical protein
MPLPRSLRMVVHCYSRKDTALRKYETELSCWKGNRKSVVMRNRQSESGKCGMDSDVTWPFRSGLLFYLVANGSDVVGSGRGA